MPIQIDLSIIEKKERTALSFKIPSEMKTGRYGFLVLFDADDYPLQQHFCYMRSKTQSETEDAYLRFVNMHFAQNSPGIPVGPWPGWRFIPSMPEVKLRIEDTIYIGRFNFWGDESVTKKLQVIINAEIQNDLGKEVELDWSDNRLRPISVTIYGSAKQKPKPVRTELMQELRNSYPRLLFCPKDVAKLSERKVSTHQHTWNKILKLKDNWNLELDLTPESKTLDGPERLHVFDRVVISAFIALMTEQNQDINLAVKTFAEFLDLALSPDFEPMQIDTQAGETLFNACIAYDWLWIFLDDEQRAAAKSKLFKMADLVWQHLGYERDDYGQAHFLGCSHGLLAFAFLFWDEHERSREWVEYFHGIFKWIIEMLPEDGYFPHGINLWIYEHIFLLRYLELFRHCAGVNFWVQTSYWQNASKFRAATLSPDSRFALTFGDPQYRVCGDAWMHFLIAARTGEKQAQELGKQLQDVSTSGVDFRSVTPRRRVWEYLFYNPEIGFESFKQDSLFFEDGSQVFYRDEDDNLLITFRANGLLGKQRHRAGEWSGYGHSDPCNGSFLIMKKNAFLVCGPGPVYRRDSSLHNTLTFDDRGQIGDSCPWAPEFVPENRFAKILKHGEEADKQWITADLTPCYLDFLGVQKCIRRFIFIQPGLLIIHDEIELETNRNIQWNLHSFGDFTVLKNDDQFQCRVSLKREKADLYCLLPSQVNCKTGLTDFVSAYPNSGERDRFLQLSSIKKSAQFLVLINLGNEKLYWKVFPDHTKKSGQIAKIIYAGNEYFI